MVKDVQRDDSENTKRDRWGKRGWINDFSVPFAIIEARNRGREGHDAYDVRATLKELKLFTDSAERVDIQAKFEGEEEKENVGRLSKWEAFESGDCSFLICISFMPGWQRSKITVAQMLIEDKCSMHSDWHFQSKEVMLPLTNQVGNDYKHIPIASSFADVQPLDLNHLMPVHGIEFQPSEICPEDFIEECDEEEVSVAHAHGHK
uniref:Uncharacterized protein n=1 Tax=Populus alba TaxID=43335 RepID=A0A4U5R2N6_POPAL|nr:hypothetical protein D5086_0000009010 [Populus alba]